MADYGQRGRMVHGQQEQEQEEEEEITVFVKTYLKKMFKLNSN